MALVSLSLIDCDLVRIDGTADMDQPVQLTFNNDLFAGASFLDRRAGITLLTTSISGSLDQPSRRVPGGV